MSCLALLAAGCGGSAPATSTADELTSPASIRISYTVNNVSASLVAIADKLGYFSKEKLNATLINAESATAHAQLLSSSQVDFAIAIDAAAVTRLRGQGVKLAFASGTLNRQPAALMCQKSVPLNGTYPQNIKVLEGKSVAVTALNTPSETITKYTILAAGVDLAKVKIIPAGGSALSVSILQAGKVDCGYVTQPAPAQLGADFKMMVDYASTQTPKELQNFVFVPIAAGPSVTDNRPVLRAFARAMKAAAKFANDPKNAQKIADALLSTYPGATADLLTKVYTASAPAWSGTLTEAMFKNTNTINEKVTGQPSDLKLTDFVSKDVIDIVSTP
jgi:NitT/TauT family transport system substrate-binding protein